MADTTAADTTVRALRTLTRNLGIALLVIAAIFLAGSFLTPMEDFLYDGLDNEIDYGAPVQVLLRLLALASGILGGVLLHASRPDAR